MMTVKVEPITFEEVRTLIPTDQLDTFDMKCLIRCGRASATMKAGMVDDEVVCIMGLIPPTILADHAYLWMNITDKLEGHEFLLARHSQMFIQKCLERYPHISGHCEIKNRKALKWLKWLGATFGELQPHGLVPFMFERKDG